MTYLPFFFIGYYTKNIDVKKYVLKIPPPSATYITEKVKERREKNKQRP
jgi:hypothetical protein